MTFFNAIMGSLVCVFLMHSPAFGEGKAPPQLSPAKSYQVEFEDGTKADTLSDYVKKFAPILFFTKSADGFGYPTSAQPFWAKWTDNGANYFGIGDQFEIYENTNSKTLENDHDSVPTYYQVREVGEQKQVRINYWWFYGYQHPCWLELGSHQGDWESVTVILSSDRKSVAAVTYNQHTGFYTRIAGPRDAPCTPNGTGRCGGGSHGFQRVGDRPVVFVGRTAHGSYHDTYGGIYGAGSCAYYGDQRSGDGPKLNSSKKLIDLDGAEEPWIASDRVNNFTWGPDGISTHPTQKPPTDDMKACEGSPTWLLADAGCYKSECLAGDDQASEDCLKECKPGYVNLGLTCNKRGWPWQWRIYGRLNSSNHYSYKYTLPTSDVGLINRRSNSEDWSLP